MEHAVFIIIIAFGLNKRGYCFLYIVYILKINNYEQFSTTRPPSTVNHSVPCISITRLVFGKSLTKGFTEMYLFKSL